jgi:putative membrane protein
MKIFFALTFAVLFLTINGCKKKEESGTPEAAIDSNKNKMDDTNRYGTTNDTTGKNGTAANVSPDFKFAVNAADGGMAEVKLGELAAKNASDKSVKEFGKKMVADHTKAGNELKALAQKKNITLPEKISDKYQKTYDDLAKKTGADFDKAYMDDMVSDHKTDVSDFESEANSGKDAELKSWANKTLPTLRHHLEMAKSTYDKVKSQNAGMQ